MRRDQLEHLIRASGAIIGDDELVVIGSQAILGSVAEPPADAVVSIEADIVPSDDPTGDKALLLSATIGEASPFQATHGIYADGVAASTAVLPEGWGDRLVALRTHNTNGVTGWCLERHDLVAAKVFAGREKDRTFVVALLAAALVDSTVVAARIVDTDVDAERQRLAVERLERWVAEAAG